MILFNVKIFQSSKLVFRHKKKDKVTLNHYEIKKYLGIKI